MLSKKEILTILTFDGNFFFNELEDIFVLKFNKNSYLSKTTNIFFPIISEDLLKKGNNNNGYATFLNKHLL